MDVVGGEFMLFAVELVDGLHAGMGVEVDNGTASELEVFGERLVEHDRQREAEHLDA